MYRLILALSGVIAVLAAGAATAGLWSEGYRSDSVIVAIMRAAGDSQVATHRGGPSWLPVQ